MKKIFTILIIFSTLILLSYHFGKKIYNCYAPRKLEINESYLQSLNSKNDDTSGRLSYYKANLHFAGYENAVDRDEAIELLISSAEKGYNEARIHLAKLFLRNELMAEGADYVILTKKMWSGDEIKLRDKSEKIQRDEALKWIHMAIEGGSAKAAYLLAKWLPWNATQEEINESMAYLEEAANTRYGPACQLLGEMYYAGRYVKKDHEKAVAYFFRAYSLGMEEAGLSLAKCYLYGTGVSQDIEKAREILLDLGRHGYADASKLLFKLCDDKIIDVQPSSGAEIYNNTIPRWPNREKMDNFLSNFSENLKMLCAARDGNWEYVSEALNYKNADINAQNAVRRTVLHYAIMQRNYDKVRSLLRHGANPNIVDASGQSAFDWALSNGRYRRFPMGHDIAMDMMEYGAAGWKINDFLKFKDRHLIQMAYDKWDIINVWNFSAILRTKNKDLIDTYLNVMEKPISEKDFMSYIRSIGSDGDMELLERFIKIGEHIKHPNKEKLIELTRDYIPKREALEKQYKK